MTMELAWMPGVLSRAGLKVSEEDGWLSRSASSMGTIKGVMCHHTATAGFLDRNMPTLAVLKKGTSKIPGPLSQLGLGRDGTFYIIAAGRANHAGRGKWPGIPDDAGNRHFIGIEAENDGLDPRNWPAVQIDAYQRGVAALLDHLNADTAWCIGHREYAPGRKPDPSFDMNSFRAAVAAIRKGQGVVRPLIAAIDAGGRPTLRRGMRGDAVKDLQTALKPKPGFEGIVIDGVFGPVTEARVRKFQREFGGNLVADGIVGPKTWAALFVGAPAPSDAGFQSPVIPQDAALSTG